jgi:signal transduction histidine kinase
MVLHSLREYALAVVSSLIALLIASFAEPFVSIPAPFVPFFGAVMITAWLAGFGPALCTIALSGLLVDYYFFPPIYSLALNVSDLLTIALFACEALVMAYIVDRLERMRRATSEHHGRLQRLHELSARLVDEHTLDEMIGEALKATMELLRAERGVVQLYDEGEQVLRLIRQVGFPDEFAKRFQRVAIGTYPCGMAFQRKARVMVDNVATEPAYIGMVPVFQTFGVVGVQSTPLFTPDGDVFGIVSCYWTKPHRPTDSDLYLLDLYAHQVGRLLLHKRTEQTLRMANAELERVVSQKTIEVTDRNVKLEHLMAELLLTEQRERRQLSLELHDTLAQLLAFARIKLALAQKAFSTSPDKVHRHVQETDFVLQRSLEYTRTLMAELDPPDLQELGVAGALRWLAERMRDHGLDVRVIIKEGTFVLSTDHTVLAYQCVRELLANVIKHAKVSQAIVTLSVEQDRILRIAVQDQGPGFDPSDVPESSTGQHFGLHSIRERMEQVGGHMTITDNIPTGCTVSLVFPLAESPDVPESRAARGTMQDRVTARTATLPIQASLPFS